MQPVTGARY